LLADCTIQFLDFSDTEAKKVFWHSSAHILGGACEAEYDCHLSVGPPIEEGFYYEMGMNESLEDPKNKRVILESDYLPIEERCKQIISEQARFERLTVSKLHLREMFKQNKFKLHLINHKIPDGGFGTVYMCGDSIDMCRGPHLPHAGKIKALKVTKNSASYFLGSKN
jgi:threonyl-tRNA synthetase